MTPVACHVGVLNIMRTAPPSRGFPPDSPAECASEPLPRPRSGESRRPEAVVRAWRRVMPLRMRRISSTSWIPSGFFLNRNWSRCRPSEDEVKAWWQYWHLRSLSVDGFCPETWGSSPAAEPSGVSVGREEAPSSMFHRVGVLCWFGDWGSDRGGIAGRG